MSHSHTEPAALPADTEVLPDAASAVEEIPSGGIPAREYLPDGDYRPEEYDTAYADGEAFVPRPRYRIGRSTKVLACILLVALGVFGGALTQKAVDGGSARSSRSALFNGSGSGAGAGGGANGGGSAGIGTNQTSVNGTNGAGQNGTAGQGRRSRQSGSGSGPSGG